MGERIRHTGNIFRQRWTAKMPGFFRRLAVVCTCIVGVAIGINTMLSIAGATPHQWWNDIYPLLVGVPTGMAITCKLTVNGGYKSVDPGKLTQGNPILGDGQQDPHDHEPHDPHHEHHNDGCGCAPDAPNLHQDNM